MFKHKEGCIWKGFEKNLTSEDSNGPNETVILMETGFQHGWNLHSKIIGHIDEDIKFNFCPVCGVVIEQETK